MIISEREQRKRNLLCSRWGASDIIKKLLPIVDNFDRGFKSVTDEELETPFAKGMDMVLSSF